MFVSLFHNYDIQNHISVQVLALKINNIPLMNSKFVRSLVQSHFQNREFRKFDKVGGSDSIQQPHHCSREPGYVVQSGGAFARQ